MTKIAHRRIGVNNLKIFYREAGRSNAPALLLLHGFPTAIHMFRDLIPRLADRFHVVAPDLPGFGQSDMPARTKFSYTFDNIARAIDRFTEVIGLERSPSMSSNQNRGSDAAKEETQRDPMTAECVAKRDLCFV